MKKDQKAEQRSVVSHWLITVARRSLGHLEFESDVEDQSSSGLGASARGSSGTVNDSGIFQHRGGLDYNCLIDSSESYSSFRLDAIRERMLL